MRSRSSRLFGILIHLVVTPNLRSKLGPVGVHPLAILLERLDLEHGLENATLGGGQPYWLQDDKDGKCLSPEGFSECGDANLWLVRKPPRKGKSNTGYALQLIDLDHLLYNDTTMEDSSSSPQYNNEEYDSLWWRRRRRSKQVEECLIPDNSRNKNRQTGESAITQMKLGLCSNKRAWQWEINEQGVLFHSKMKSSRMGWGHVLRLTRPSDYSAAPPLQQATRQCVVRDGGSMMLDECTGKTKDNVDVDSLSNEVAFSLVRYKNSGAVGGSATDISTEQTAIEESAMHGMRDIDDLNSGINSLSMSHGLTATPVKKQHHLYPLHSATTPLTQRQTTYLLRQSHPSIMSFDSHRDMLKANKVSAFDVDDAPVHGDFNLPEASFRMPQKIPTHPYIEASKDNVWLDEVTDLEFPTDLCAYLGHDCKESGRHTLAGVGQYTKTVFKLKIYGVALYISKRDLLADSRFYPYATMDAESLKDDVEFYELLMSEGHLDRTLFLNLNMQLSCDTMRSSLEADWQFLSPDHKRQLNSMTLKPRLANEDMLEKIMDEKENPSRCSCGQIAPMEYEADISCCSRGSELVYTWRKNGDMEVRLDGRLLEVFDDPLIGQGIFYEYLRRDDPMSVEARDAFADGFPFLLRPLSRAGNMKFDQTPRKAKKTKKAPAFPNPIFAVGGMVFHTASYVGGWMKSSADETMDHFINTSRMVGSSAHGVAVKLNQRRDWMASSVVNVAMMSTLMVASRVPFFPEEWKHHMEDHIESNTGQIAPIAEWDGGGSPKCTARLHHSRIGDCIPSTHSTASYGPEPEPLFDYRTDEIGVLSYPGMNSTRQIFLFMVHLYLVLLLIVSLPADQSTTVLIKCKREGGSDREVYYVVVNEKSQCNVKQEGDENSHGHGGDANLDNAALAANNNVGRMKKSLSYFL